MDTTLVQDHHDGVVVHCRLQLDFYSGQHAALSSFVLLALRSACGLGANDLFVDTVESDQHTNKSTIAFRVVRENHASAWQAVGSVRKAILNDDSPLHSFPRMKNVFNGSRLEVFDLERPSEKRGKLGSSGTGKLRYVAKAPHDGTIASKLPSDTIREPVKQLHKASTLVLLPSAAPVVGAKPVTDSSILPDRRLAGIKLELPASAVHDPVSVVITESDGKIKAPQYSRIERCLTVQIPEQVQKKSNTFEFPVCYYYDLTPIEEALKKPMPRMPSSLTTLMHELKIA